MSIQNFNIDQKVWDKYTTIFSANKSDKRVKFFLNTWFKYFGNSDSLTKDDLLFRFKNNNTPPQLKNSNFKEKYSNLSDDHIHPEWFGFFISVINHIISKKDNIEYKRQIKTLILEYKDSVDKVHKFIFYLLSHFFTFSEKNYK